ncbi:hypothetical protein [Microbispora bryophytorum]
MILILSDREDTTVRRVLPEVVPDGAPTPVEKRAGPLVRDAAAWAAA